jgi:HEAT repeat protein
MSELIERLRSDDSNERAKALAALVGEGRAAVPALLRALDDPDAGVRAQAARALVEIADPETADRLAAATEDTDPGVRGHAARGLARLGDPRALDALVRTIDDLPDPLHHPFTGSVYSLIDLGAPALPAVAPLLESDDPTTRLRAFMVVQSVVSAAENWSAVWDATGRYDPNAESSDASALTRWIHERS